MFEGLFIGSTTAGNIQGLQQSAAPFGLLLQQRMSAEQQARHQQYVQQSSFFATPCTAFTDVICPQPSPNFFGGNGLVVRDPVKLKPAKKIRDYSEHLKRKDDKILPLEDRV